MEKQQDVKFTQTIVDVDGAGISKQTLKPRKRKASEMSSSSWQAPAPRKKVQSKRTVHGGRVFLLRNRENGQNLWVPLPNKTCAKGSAGPAERRTEIEAAMQKHLSKSCYLGADSGPAIQGFFASTVFFFCILWGR